MRRKVRENEATQVAYKPSTFRLTDPTNLLNPKIPVVGLDKLDH